MKKYTKKSLSVAVMNLLEESKKDEAFDLAFRNLSLFEDEERIELVIQLILSEFKHYELVLELKSGKKKTFYIPRPYLKELIKREYQNQYKKL